MKSARIALASSILTTSLLAAAPVQTAIADIKEGVFLMLNDIKSLRASLENNSTASNQRLNDLELRLGSLDNNISGVDKSFGKDMSRVNEWRGSIEETIQLFKEQLGSLERNVSSVAARRSMIPQGPGGGCDCGGSAIIQNYLQGEGQR